MADTHRSAGAPLWPSRLSRRSRLLRRLATLRNLEAFNILWFWLLFGWAWSQAAFPARWGVRVYALLVVCVILAEGAWYWHSKRRSLAARRPLPGYFRPLFRRLKRLNLMLLAASLPLAGLLLALGLSRPFDLIVGALLLLFAGVEHLNYFHVQLMHDSASDWAYLQRHRRLRRAPLAEDLKGG